MAQETIEAVRKAEAAAEQTEKNAAVEAEAILAQAKLSAKKAVEELTRSAKEKSRTDAAEAKRQGDALVAKAQEEVQDDCKRLRTSAAAKTEQATKAILAELI